jgi:transposase InsO family protein
LIGRRIKVLISDNGGEYNSMDFNDFCIEAGIKWEYTIPYNPQQNGVAERNKRSIFEETKAMIHDQNIPMILWEEVSMTSIYIQNESPYKIMKNMTLGEAFTREKLEVGHFRIFGCLVYFLVPKEKRTKLYLSRRKGTITRQNSSLR